MLGISTSNLRTSGYRGLGKIAKLIIAYFARVTAAGGVTECKECLATKLNSLDAIQLLDNASLITIPSGYKSGVVYSQVPTSGLGDLDFTRASTATRINSSSLIESVASGVPRLTYPIGGGCPSLLLEPQRTNILQRSEQFDNAYWEKYRCDIGINAQISPSGIQNAETITSSVGETIIPAITTSGLTFSGNTRYSTSLFVKKLGTADTFRLAYVDNVINFAGGLVVFNVVTQAITITQPANNSITASIEDYGNGWYRLIMNFLTIAIPTFNYIEYAIPTVSTTNTFAVWGAQLEAGTYPTSYIPTVASSVTRLADTASKTGITSLIGQTEGTIYAEIKVNKLIGTASRYIFHISDGTANNRIYMAFSGSSSNVLRGRIFNGGTLQCSIDSSTITTTGTYKLALAYKNNDIVFYINGVQIGVDTSATIPTCSQVDLGHNYAGASQLSDGVANANLYKTRLSNSQLASLTTL